MMNKLVCIVGMCGSGKSEVANALIKEGYEYLRFGQITLDEIKKRGLPINEANEKAIREEFRKNHGMAAYATLNFPNFDQMLKKSNVVGDGLYSWSEYKVLKQRYGKQLIIIAVCASPEIRYFRLENRSSKYKNDPKAIYRSISPQDAQKRDYSEIENIEKCGPIAMADYYLVNESDLEELNQQIKNMIQWLRPK